MTTDKKSTREKFSDEIYEKTINYQKNFGFEIGSRPEHKVWNNESDAFKHAFMQAVLSFRINDPISHIIGTGHELEGKFSNQPKGEENMDLWNNFIGREIAKEVKQEIKGKEKFFTTEQIEDMAAVKIMQRIKRGELITNPNDKRSFKKKMKGSTTGYATPIPTQPFTGEQIGQMSTEEFSQNEQYIMDQLKDGLIKPQSEQTKDYSGYVNPISGNSKIFSREDIANLSGQEYSTFEKEIMAQLNSIGVPTNNDLQFASSKGGTVYVKPYTRDDGTEVRGYYRALPV